MEEKENTVSVKVFILTQCRDMNLLYGATLTLKTLRVGFPSADVTVVDNASIVRARATLRKLARQAGAAYHQLEQKTMHCVFLEYVILNHAGPVAIVDPDVMFWECVEDWKFDALLAGRHIPAYKDDFTRCTMMPRLHSSFWFIPDARALGERLLRIKDEYRAFMPLVPVMFPVDGEWYFFDVGASLCAAIPREIYNFTKKELDCFDHLFAGTHAAAVAQRLPGADGSAFLQWHADAKEDCRRLRGIWREQQEYFTRYSVDADHIVAPSPAFLAGSVRR